MKLESNHENTKSQNHENKEKHQFEELSRKIIGAAIEIHRVLGSGFLENIYEEAFKLQLSKLGIHYDSQKEIKIEYLGEKIGLHRVDMIDENEIIVELKAMKELTDIYFAQLLSYLKAANLKVGLLINFSKPTLEIRRVVN
jgi:GxxExxY protein